MAEEEAFVPSKSDYDLALLERIFDPDRTEVDLNNEVEVKALRKRAIKDTRYHG